MAKKKTIEIPYGEGRTLTIAEGHPQERHVYVVAFSSGTVKVGMSSTPKQRIGHYVSHATIHNDRITDCWVSAPHWGASGNEQKLVGFCQQYGAVLVGREYFRGVPFEAVKRYAETLPFERYDENAPEHQFTGPGWVETIEAINLRLIQEANCRALGFGSPEEAQQVIDEGQKIFDSMSFVEALNFYRWRRAKERAEEEAQAQVRRLP